MNGIQTAKSFNFFYAMLGLVAVGAVGLLFQNEKHCFRFTLIDGLLLLYVLWVTINKYLIHDIYCFSLKYYELLGLSVLYIIIRFIDKKYYLLFLVAICFSGTVQAVYGCLQLWGYYPSHHGLFNMTGSFFNPGPYAGYLCCILPIALGLYWSSNHKEHEGGAKKHGVVSLIASQFDANAFEKFEGWRRSMLLRLGLQQQPIKQAIPMNIGTNSEASNVEDIKQAKPSKVRSTSNILQHITTFVVKYIAFISIVSILLVLPAARSRAAWLGAIAGCAFLVWHKYNIVNWFKQAQPSNARRASNAKRQTAKLSNAKRQTFNSSLRKWLIVTVLAVFFTGVCTALYFYKKDSANGRLLIWKVTTEIIKDYPWFGVGQDMFQAHYMEYQAEYFKAHPGSKYEQVAGDNNYVFNEFLKVFVENGIIGFLILIGGLVVSFLGHRETQSKHRVSPKKNNSMVFSITHILKAFFLSILVFGCFGYPSEILSIKLILVTVLASLSSLILKRETSNVSVANINREASNSQTACSASNNRSEAEINLKPVTCNLNWSAAKIGVAKTILTLILLTLAFLPYPEIAKLKTSYITWNDAYDLYKYNLYEECLDDYEKAYPILKNKGEFLLNYGKALSMAEKHTKAIAILEQSENYLQNTVTYTALGDCYQQIGKNGLTEQVYLKAHYMSLGRFYAQYLLVKYYESVGKKKEAILLAQQLIEKTVKVPSMAVDEITDDMKALILRISNDDNNS
jgi:O-antigen ligase